MNPIIKAKKYAREISKTQKIQMKEALKVVAKENGFSDWKSYKNSIDTFWYSKFSPFLNHWFVSYSKALTFRKKQGGYLLTYKGQFFVASKNYIEHLGLDPDDNVWKLISYDVSSSNSLEKFFKYFGKPKK